MGSAPTGGGAYPSVLHPDRIGSYPATVGSGGGYVWDAVLEYRVWCCPSRGAPDEEDGSDYYYVFASFEEAMAYAESNPGTEHPIALVLQREYIEEPEPGEFVRVREERMTEWPVEFLERPRRTDETLDRFFASNAPENRVEVIRGLASWPD